MDYASHVIRPIVDLRAVSEASPGDVARVTSSGPECRWTPGQLDGEVARGQWTVAAASADNTLALATSSAKVGHSTAPCPAQTHAQSIYP